MHYSFLALVSASLAALSNAYTQPVGANPSGNPISKPGLGEIVPAGIPYTITWNPTTTGTVTLVLLRGPSTNILPLYPIVEGIPNTGSYVWTPSTALQADVTHYGIQLIVDATGQYQYTSQFGISNSGGSSSSSGGSLSTSSSTSTSTSTSTGYTIPGPLSSAPYVYRYNTSNSTGYTIPASTGFVPTTVVLPTTPKTVASSTPAPTTPATAPSSTPSTGAAAKAIAAAPAMVALAGLAVLVV